MRSGSPWCSTKAARASGLLERIRLPIRYMRPAPSDASESNPMRTSTSLGCAMVEIAAKTPSAAASDSACALNKDKSVRHTIARADFRPRTRPIHSDSHGL